jgi:hypothetical protein
MKVSRCVVLTLSALISIAGGCSEPTQPEEVPPPPTPVVPVNTAPKAFAGPDVLVPLPVSSWMLYGSATDAESNIESYSWRKISGPSSYSVESPESKQTQVANLEQGRYEFELTVTDKGGLIGKDTVGISVYEPRIPGANEFVFKNVEWHCPMGCTLKIDNFQQYIRDGTAIRVFLNRGDAAEWTEVKPEQYWVSGDRYVYGIYNDYLQIYTDDEIGAVDVKIIF